MEKRGSIFVRGLVLMSVVLLMTILREPMRAEAKDISLVKGANVSYLGYSTHYYYVDGNLAFCLEPDKNSPGNGNYSSSELDGNDLLGKAMYYVYGGPGYETYMKPTMTGGWDGDAPAYCLSHCILSYIYDGCNSQSAAFLGLNEDIKSAVVMYADAIKSWPDIPSTDISLSETNLTAYYSTDERCQRTGSIICNGDSTNSLVFHVPEGVTLVNETTGSRQSGQTEVRGGEHFYLMADVDYGNGETWESGELRSTVTKGWRTLVVQTGEGSQDIGTGTVITVEPVSISMRVSWIPKPELEVSKLADKSEKKYKLGDIITYTMDVTQQIQGAVAKNVTISDTIITEGVKLQKNSIVLLDESQCIISDAVITVKGNTFSIHAGEFLQGSNTGEKYTVEYQVAITDESVIGREIENQVIVRADNAEEVEETEIVTVEEPKEPEEPEEPEVSQETNSPEPEESPKPELEKIQKPTQVKTGDSQNLIVLSYLLILSCTVIITCVTMNARRRARRRRR